MSDRFGRRADAEPPRADEEDRAPFVPGDEPLSAEMRDRLITEASRDLLLLLDPTGVILWASPSHLNVLGREPASLLGSHCIDFVHPDDRERHHRLFLDRVHTHAPLRNELRASHLDGSWVLTESIGVPVDDEHGDVKYVVVSARDITDRSAAEQRLRQIVQQIPANVWTTDASLRLTSTQGGALAMIGIATGEAVGKPLSDFLEGDPILDRLLELHERALAGASFSFESHWRDRDLLVTMEPLRGEAGQIDGVIGIALDTTDQKLAERKYRQLFERNVAGVFRSTISGRILECNPSFARIFGYDSPEQMLRIPTSELYFSNDDREALLKVLHMRGEAVNYETRLKRSDGHAVWVLMNEILVLNPGEETTLEGTVVDITARKLAEERIEYQAFHDSLTALPNRFLLNDRLALALAQARRHDRSVALLFLDLDHFKHVNDTMSHNAGDDLLKSVAARLTGAIRIEDTVARIGGDEFVFILPELPTQGAAAGAAKVAEKVLESFQNPFSISGREIFVTASIGIAISPSDGHDIETLVKHADSAMYRAKEMGRNSYQFHTPHSQRRAEVRLTLESGLRRALERDELFVVYQPQVSLSTGLITGFEALLRWNRPGVGVVPPKDFIPLAEEIGLIVPIGEWVLWNASRQMHVWHSQGYEHLRLAINLSPRQFQHEKLTRMVERVLEETQMPAESLELEITESLSIYDSDLTIGRLSHFRSMGISAALDDFGTGYSSLSHLRMLPIDTVKIDRSFIGDMVPATAEYAIVQAVITMAHSLKLRVVAEGVEQESQRRALVDLGCDEMQGYIYSRPVPPVEADSLLREERLRKI
jgi:diguanylate cyclase (GGDEF)-like protein/PAS domain S-box-containing protein